MKGKELKGKRLAVFGANNVVDEVTAYARRHGIVLVSVGNVPEAPMHRASDEQYYMDFTCVFLSHFFLSCAFIVSQQK